MSSVSQIVSEIIDALSDGISSLVLSIIQLKEQNAQMPERVPHEAQKTIQNAIQLSRVGILLAEKDYASFPDIANEIVAASKDAIEATALLSNSIESMSDSDRKKGWEGILQSCSVMAEKTIKLLQIVYGAEMKKLLSLNETIQKISKDLNPNNASLNPEDFANNASNAGQKALQIARLADALSKGNQFPWIKELLAQLSKDIAGGAEDLVNLANELLEDPNDPLRARKFEEAKNRLLKLLGDMLSSLQEAPLDNSKLATSLVPLNNEALRAINADLSQLDRSISNIKDLLDQLVNAAKNGDKELYDKLLAEIKKSIDDAKELAKKHAELMSDNPNRYDQISDLLNELENIIPQQIEEAEKLNAERDLSKLLNATKRLKNSTEGLLNHISNVIRPTGILETLKKIEDELDKVKKNVHEGKENDTKARIEPFHNHINDDALNLCNMIHDNDRRNDILESLDRLNRAFKKLCDSIGTDDFDKALKEYLDALQHVSKVTNAPRLDALQNLKSEIISIQTLDDPDAIQRSAIRLTDEANQLIDLSKNRGGDEESELEDFERALKRELLNVIKVLNDPNSAEHRNSLAESSVPLLKTAFALERKIIDPQNNHYGTLQTTGTTGDIDDSIRKLLENLLRLKGIVPSLGTEEDEKAKEELEKLLPVIKKSITHSNNMVTNNKNDISMATLEQAKRSNELLLKELSNKDKTRTLNQSKALSNNVKQLIGILSTMADNDESGKKAPRFNAFSDELKSRLADALRKLKSIIVEEGEDPEPLKETLVDIDNTLDRIKNVIYDPSHDEKNMRDNSEELQNKLRVLKVEAKKGNKEGVEGQIKSIDIPVNNFIRASRKRKIYNANNNKNDDVLKEFIELSNKIGHTARELAKNPNDTKLNEAYATLETAILHHMNIIKEKEGVSEISCLQDIEDSITSIQDGVRQNDASVINISAKDAVMKMNLLVDILNNHADPQKKDLLDISFKNLGDNIKDLLKTASKYHKEGKEEDKKKTDEIVASSKLDIAKMIAVLTKSRDKKSTPEHIREAQLNPTDNNTLQKALESTYVLALKENDLHKRDCMEKGIVDVSKKQKAYQVEPTSSNKKKLENSIEHLYGEVMKDCVDNEIQSYSDAIQKTDVINAHDDAHVQEDCAELVESLENHVKSTMEVSRQKKGIYTDPKDKITDKSLNNLGNEIKSINVPPRKSIEEAKTFEDVLEHVANDIQDAIGDSSQSSNAAEIVSGSGIVFELRRLAEAARNGKASEMLLAAKAVAKYLSEIIQEIKDVISKMGKRNPIEQEKLLKSTVSLSNYGTQMKILTSVKASSIELNTDNDETLLSITKSLGKMLADSIKTIDTVKIAVLKEK